MNAIRLTIAGKVIVFADADAESVITAIRSAAAGKPTETILMSGTPLQAVASTAGTGKTQHFAAGVDECHLADF